MTTKITAAAANAACNAIVGSINTGGAGTLTIYGGTQPANPETAPGASALATISLNNPAFGAASSGVAVLDVSPQIEDAMADAGGNAAWFRITNGNGTAVIDGAVGQDPPGTAELILNTTTITAGGPVRISSFTFTVPRSA